MNKRLHVVGDSISIQYGPHLKRFTEGSFVYTRKTGTQQMLDDPQGANAGDSSMVHSYLQDCQRRGEHWDVLMINCGLHDIKRDPLSNNPQIPIKSYDENLHHIIQIAGGIASRIIWVSTTPVDTLWHNSSISIFRRLQEDVWLYNKAAAAVMGKYGIKMADLFLFTSRLDIDVSKAYQDHVHFTDDVRVMQAAFLAGFLHAIE